MHYACNFTAYTRDTDTRVLLALYEFEALAMLGEPDMEKVIDRVALWPDIDPEVLEALAGILKSELLFHFRNYFNIHK